MKHMIIFCLESKNPQENSDGIYIRETLDKFYLYDKHETIIRYIYMNGKSNFVCEKATRLIKKFINKLSKEDVSHHVTPLNNFKIIYRSRKALKYRLAKYKFLKISSLGSSHGDSKKKITII